MRSQNEIMEVSKTLDKSAVIKQLETISKQPNLHVVASIQRVLFNKDPAMQFRTGLPSDT